MRKTLSILFIFLALSTVALIGINKSAPANASVDTTMNATNQQVDVWLIIKKIQQQILDLQQKLKNLILKIKELLFLYSTKNTNNQPATQFYSSNATKMTLELSHETNPTTKSNISLTANISSSTCDITKVSFFANNNLIGTTITEPHTINWQPVNAGDYTIKVMGLDCNQVSVQKAVKLTIAKEKIAIKSQIPITTKPSRNTSTKQPIIQSVDMTDSTQSASIERWKPVPGLSWHWQLTGDIDLNHPVDVYDIDLETTPLDTIAKLQAQGKKVICYFSAGTYEKFRSDAHKFPQSVLGKTMGEWPDEKWLDVSNYPQFAHIMTARLDLAKQKDCDGVEPDNVDGFRNSTGFSLTYNDQLNYNKWLAKEAHKRNLSIALKNNVDQVKDLVDLFDFAINEQCFQYNECQTLLPFIKQDKAVFGVEYELPKSSFCAKANQWQFSWLKMNYNLAGYRSSCN